ncbi:hypothetical protein TcBrA4_0000980 [Trypanosoma cruzi]|nr:hypothetical protein TcBrA4_0000980 [Trypanosoma cruzi]
MGNHHQCPGVTVRNGHPSTLAFAGDAVGHLSTNTSARLAPLVERAGAPCDGAVGHIGAGEGPAHDHFIFRATASFGAPIAVGLRCGGGGLLAPATSGRVHFIPGVDPTADESNGTRLCWRAVGKRG